MVRSDTRSLFSRLMALNYLFDSLTQSFSSSTKDQYPSLRSLVSAVHVHCPANCHKERHPVQRSLIHTYIFIFFRETNGRFSHSSILEINFSSKFKQKTTQILILHIPRMKIQLPLETWADLLPFVPRHQLLKFVKQLGDRQFTSILQFFLTEDGQITLAPLHIVAPQYCNVINGPIVEVRKEMPSIGRVWEYGQWQLPRIEINLAEGPMPTNIKDFKLIELSHFDLSVANFLRRFKQVGNSLLDNVNLRFSSRLSISPRDYANPLMQIIAQVMPTIGNINSIHMCHLNYLYGQHDVEGVNNYSRTLKAMLRKTRILDSTNPNSIFKFRTWLYTPRSDGKPRALRRLLSAPNTVKFTEAMKKEFPKHTLPASSFVCVRVNEYGDLHWQDSLDNARTNERLMIKTVDPTAADLNSKKIVQISRYPMGATKEWIEANEREIMEWKFEEHNRRIGFKKSLGYDPDDW